MLKDDSPMPYGKFKGLKMEKVPAAYLLWLGEEIKKKFKPNASELEMLTYIKDNEQVLIKEKKENGCQ